MCHGKDNIMFHSIILNALLLGQEDNYHLVDTIVSAEYLNFNDQKFSKSKGIGMTALEALDLYDSDSLRYHLIANGPEKKDTNFTIEDFENTHNGEMVNKFGNLVNRTLKFKGLEEIPNGTLDPEIEKAIKETYVKTGELVEKLEFREAVRTIMELVELGNKYYDEKQPWIAKKENEEEFNNIIYTCSTIILNLSNLYAFVIPTACDKLRSYFKVEKPCWEIIYPEKGLKLENIEPLFTRYEKK
jgi:methionyl-tRNA synthetase